MTTQSKTEVFDGNIAPSTVNIEKNQGAKTESKLKNFFQQHRNSVISVLTVFALFLIWYVIAALKIVPPLFLPTPQSVWQKFLQVSQ